MPAWNSRRKQRFWGNLILLLLLWGDLFVNLSLEWELNPQYSYGYLVPFLGLYLLYSRWETRPPVAPNLPAWSVTLAFAVSILLLFPLRLAFEANPDWRLLMWVHALLLFGLTQFFIYAFAGKAWVKHFFWGWIFLMIAVPWPIRIETPLIQGLMRMVASVTVEILNLLGVNASQSGNLIRLPDALVGVEEACSGVRSFQSAIMAALFFSEFFRFRLGSRLLVLLGGVALSIFLNLIRTFTLTWVAHVESPDAMKHWHDPVGYFVYFGSFAFIFGLAVILKKWAVAPSAYPATRSPFLRGSSRGLIPVSGLVLCALLWLLGWIGNQLYYHLQEDAPDYLVRATTDYENIPYPVRSIPISDAIQAQLRFQEGRQVVWANPDKRLSWTLFFFTWEKGAISSFAGVHRPEICLQAAGLRMVRKGPIYTWEQQGLSLQLHSYTFRSSVVEYHVFFSVWEREEGRPVPLDHDYGDRLNRVQEGIRVAARQSIQVVVSGHPDLETAARDVLETLDTILYVENTSLDGDLQSLSRAD